MSIWTPCYDLVEEAFTRRANWNRVNPTAFVTLQCPKGWEEAVAYDLIQFHRPWPYRDLHTPGQDVNCDVKFDPTPGTGQYILPPLKVQSVSIRVPKTTYTDPGTPTNPSETEGKRMSYAYSLLDVTYGAEHGFVHNAIDTNLQDGAQKTWCNAHLYAEETWEPEIRYLTVDHDLLEWEGIAGYKDGKKTPFEKAEEVGIPRRRGKIVRKVSGYTDITKIEEMDGGSAKILQWEGGVHKYDYTSNLDGWTYSAGRLMLNSIKVRKTYFNFQPDIYTFTIEGELTYQPEGWEKLYRTVSDGTDDKSGFYNVYYKDGGQFKPLQEFDMRMFLFQENDGGTPTSTGRVQLCPI